MFTPLSIEAVGQIQENQKYLHAMRKHRSVHQIFHITCPKCGHSAIISNGSNSDGTLTLSIYGEVEFNCPSCKEEMSIPVLVTPAVGPSDIKRQWIHKPIE